MSYIEKEDIVYCLTKDDIQYEAIDQIGRTLTEDEMLAIVKRLDYEIGEHMLYIWPAIFEKKNGLLMKW